MSAMMIPNDYMPAGTAQPLAGCRPPAHLQALNLLCAMGWHYLPPATCLAMRGSRRQVLLQSTLLEVLQTRRYQYNGQSHLLTPNGIEQIVRELNAISLQHGVAQMNAALYEKLRLGITITEFLPDGKKHQPTIAVIDWQNRKANRFEVAEMVAISNSQGKQVRHAGLVCYVNGIPLAVIEAPPAKPGQSESQLLQEGIARHMRHQQLDEIAPLYVYAQLLLTLGVQEARFGTIASNAAPAGNASASQSWSRWREEQFCADYFHKLHNTALSVETRNLLQTEQTPQVRNQLKQLWHENQTPNAAQETLISLLSPPRLLEYLHAFVLFDQRLGKIVARSEQFFAVRAMLDRVSQRNERGARHGGIVWHAGAGGKGMTLVFLSKALMLHEQLKECRLLIVCARSEREAQLTQAFHGCGAHEPSLHGKCERGGVRAAHHLARRIGSGHERILFTQMAIFHTATSLDLCYNPSHQLIVLLEDSPDSEYAELHLRMRKTLPRAGFLAIERSITDQAEKEHNPFGPLLHRYTLPMALQDDAALPVLHEARPVPDTSDAATIGRWFQAGRPLLNGLTPAQQMASEQLLQKMVQQASDAPRQALLAWDIVLHFGAHLKPLGQCAVLLCNSGQEALLYQQLLQIPLLAEAPSLRCAVLAPSAGSAAAMQPENGANGTNGTAMAEHPAQHDERQLQNALARGELDLLILSEVAPAAMVSAANAVLYLDRQVHEADLPHLFTCINRPYQAAAQRKQYGMLIDYRDTLAQFDAALRAQHSREAAEAAPRAYLAHAAPRLPLEAVSRQYLRLPQLQHALLAYFQPSANQAREQVQATTTLLDDNLREHLRQSFLPPPEAITADESAAQRAQFYRKLAEFAVGLQLALASRGFFADAEQAARLPGYRQSLEFFSGLREVVRHDAQEKLSAPAAHYLTDDLSAQQLDRLLQFLLPHFTFKTGVSIEQDALPQESWSQEKLHNETTLIHKRLHQHLEQDLADDPYAQSVYAALLQSTLLQLPSQEAPQQYQLLHALEEKIHQRELDILPAIFHQRRQAASYYGLFRLVLGEAHFARINAAQHSAYIDQALAIDDTVQTTLRENTLNLDHVESIIRSKLLPRLFLMLGTTHARALLAQIVQITQMRAGTVSRKAA